MIRPAEPNGLDLTWFLGKDGPVRESLSGYEPRAQQLEMALAVQIALEKNQTLIVEAGTGVGKSFAYLIPALSFAVQNKKKLAVSTFTISLQEQLLHKDIPFLKRTLPMEFTAVLAKGRGNYLCWRRLEYARKRQQTLFEHPDQFEILNRIYDWALQTQDGSLSSLPQKPPAAVWESVCSENSTCLGRTCEKADLCFYQRARKKLYSADLVITNHALLFSDLALRLEGGSFLPRFDGIVFDEALNLEDVAGGHFGLRITNAQLRFLLNRLYNPKTQKGVLSDVKNPDTAGHIESVSRASESFFQNIRFFCEKRRQEGSNTRIPRAGIFENVLDVPLRQLSGHLRTLSESAATENDRLEYLAYADRAAILVDGMELFTRQIAADYVYWAETSARSHNPLTVICAAPLHVGPQMKKALYDTTPAVIMTSATLSTQTRHDADVQEGPQGFEFFTSRLGLEGYHAVQLGSPFDYLSQAQLFVHADLPDPTKQEDLFLEKTLPVVQTYLLRTQGHAFLLFTSFKQLNYVADRLQEFCQRQQYPMLVQGRDRDRTGLLNEFRKTPHSILFGTDSFWQGVDVPGEALSNVIIFKLPFAVPDDPLLQARMEQIRKEGHSPFFQYQLPQAVLKLKQGFGRLIRTRSDKGIVVILDPRVVTRSYGRVFLDALPACPIQVIQSDSLSDFSSEPPESR